MDVVFTEREGYLEATLWETDSIAVLKEQFTLVLKSCTERTPERLLCDMTAFRGPWSVMDRYELGIAGAQFAPHVGRVACLARPGMIDPEKFGAQVARNRGLNVDVFEEREKALAWLLNPA